jgi:hypothetical protein
MTVSWHPLPALLSLTLLGQRLAAQDATQPQPPDTQPGWYAQDSAWSDGKYCSGHLLRVLVLGFQPRTPDSVRAGIIARIGATLVGGRRVALGEGLYHISLPADSSATEIRGELERLPEIAFAVPIFCFE